MAHRPPRSFDLQQLNNIPIELKNNAPFVYWRSLNNKKIPFNANTIDETASVSNYSTWATFPVLLIRLQRLVEDWPDTLPMVIGAGIIIHSNDNVIVVDLDDPTNLSSEGQQHQHTLYNKLVATGTYIERSPSGIGWRAFILGTVPQGVKPQVIDHDAGIEIYSENRFVTVTGDHVTGKGVADAQHIINEYFTLSADAPEPEEVVERLSTLYGRRIDYGSHDAVLHDVINGNGIFKGRKGFMKWLNDPNGGGDMSRMVRDCIGELDKVCGDPDMVMGIMMASVLIQQGVASNGAPYTEKLLRIYQVNTDRYIEIRKSNDRQLKKWYVQYEMAKAAARRQDSMQKEAYARKLRESEERKKQLGIQADINDAKLTPDPAVYPPQENPNKQSPFPLPYVDTSVEMFQSAPGTLGRIITELYEGMENPVHEYVASVGIARIASIGARTFSFEGHGCSANFLMIGRTRTGKSTAQRILSKFLYSAGMGYGDDDELATLTGPVASAAYLHTVLMETPSLYWYIDEARSAIKKVTVDESTNDQATQLKEAVMLLYDSTHNGSVWTSAGSQAGKKEGRKPVRDVRVSSVWSTTPETIEQYVTKQLQVDGFLSRFIYINYKGTIGNTNKSPRKQFSNQIVNALKMLNNIAQTTNKLVFEGRGKKSKIHVAIADDARKVLTTYIEEAKEFTKRIHNGQHNQAYHIASRIGETATMLAMLCASTDWAFNMMQSNEHIVPQGDIDALMFRIDAEVRGNRGLCHKPIITKEHMIWALQFVATPCFSIIRDMLGGVVGVDGSDAITKVVDKVRTILRRERNKPVDQLGNAVKMIDGVMYVKRGKLANELSIVSPFKHAPTGSSGTMYAQQTITSAVDDGDLIEIEGSGIQLAV